MRPTKICHSTTREVHTPDNRASDPHRVWTGVSPVIHALDLKTPGLLSSRVELTGIGRIGIVYYNNSNLLIFS